MHSFEAEEEQDNAWTKINEELKELPFCELQQQVTPVGLCLSGNGCSCGLSGLCAACAKKGVYHKLLGPIDPSANTCVLFSDIAVHKGLLKTFSKELFLEPDYLKEEVLFKHFKRAIKSAKRWQKHQTLTSAQTER